MGTFRKDSKDKYSIDDLIKEQIVHKSPAAERPKSPSRDEATALDAKLAKRKAENTLSKAGAFIVSSTVPRKPSSRANPSQATAGEQKQRHLGLGKKSSS